MRIIVLIILASCNQFVYDELYRAFTEQALVDNDMSLRSVQIETLRMLCNGQLSTWEEKNK